MKKIIASLLVANLAYAAEPEFCSIHDCPAMASQTQSSLVRDIGVGVARLATVLTLGITATALLMRRAGDKQGLAFVLANAVAVLLSSSLSETLSELGNNLALQFAPFMANPNLQKIIHFKERFDSKKHLYTPEMQNEFENIHLIYSYFIRRFNAPLKEFEIALEEILRLPLKPKAIETNNTDLKKLLATYPSGVRQDIAELVTDIIAISRVEKPTSRVQTRFLLGAPGTGKTHLIKAIAHALKIRFQLVSLANYKKPEGDIYWSSMGSEKGIILDALLQPGEHNDSSVCILFVDEIDKAFQKDTQGKFINDGAGASLSYLYELLEASTTQVSLKRYEGAVHPIRHLIVVLAGNKGFEELFEPVWSNPLNQRVTNVYFNEGFNRESKITIAMDMLSKEGVNNLEYHRTQIEAIVDADIENKTLGVRDVIKAVRKYAGRIRNKDLIEFYSGQELPAFRSK